jgi:hypothetical protein
MTETMEDCEICDLSGSLSRRPSMFSNIKPKPKQKEKVGDHVKSFIEEATQDLKQQKEDLRNKND